MAGPNDDDERKRTNAGFAPHPPGLGGSGMAPKGSVGTEGNSPQRESDLMMTDVYIKDGDQFKGPYSLVRQPDLSKDSGPTQEKQEPDNRGKVHFHETGDEAVDRHYQEQGEVMVPDRERQAEAKVQELYAQARDEDDGGHEPDSDRHYAQNAHEQGRDQGEGNSLADEYHERSRGR